MQGGCGREGGRAGGGGGGAGGADKRGGEEGRKGRGRGGGVGGWGSWGRGGGAPRPRREPEGRGTGEVGARAPGASPALCASSLLNRSLQARSWKKLLYL